MFFSQPTSKNSPISSRYGISAKSAQMAIALNPCSVRMIANKYCKQRFGSTAIFNVEGVLFSFYILAVAVTYIDMGRALAQ